MKGKVTGEAVVWVGGDKRTKELLREWFLHGRKGWRWKDMAGGGIALKVTEMSEDDVLDTKPGGMVGPASVSPHVPCLHHLFLHQSLGSTLHPEGILHCKNKRRPPKYQKVQGRAIL